MGRASLTELFHLVLGMVLTAALFEAAAWAYPIGAGTILEIGWIMTVAVFAMAVGPLMRAWREERSTDPAAAHTGTDHG